MKLQDYENITKPKVIPEKSNQTIFDSTVRALYQQKIPCFKMYEKILETDPDPIDLCDEAMWDTATFNSKGHRSPLLIPFNMEDMRSLQRQVGYEKLQFLPSRGLQYYSLSVLEEDDTSHATTMIMVNVLEKRGIISKEGIRLLVALEEAHNYWADDCRGYMGSEHAADRDRKCVSELYYNFSRIADRYCLDRAVMRFSNP